MEVIVYGPVPESNPRKMQEVGKIKLKERPIVNDVVHYDGGFYAVSSVIHLEDRIGVTLSPVHSGHYDGVL
jgi:hypothetical protein